MQTSQTNERALAPAMVRDAIRALGVGNVNLDHNQFRRIVDGERFHMFVHNDRPVIGR